MDANLRYESLTRFSVEIMLVVTIAALINITYRDLESIMDVISYCLAFIALISVILLVIYAHLYPIAFKEDILLSPDNHARHKLLFGEFKTNKNGSFCFYSYFLMRRLFFSFVLV